MFWVVTRLSEDFTVTTPNVGLMFSTIILAENDDWRSLRVSFTAAIFCVAIARGGEFETSESIFQICTVLSSYRVK